MTSETRTSSGAAKALAAGLATGMPLLMAPQVALAETSTVVAASVSGLVGTTCGALVTGIVGYALHLRSRREFERVVGELVKADERARDSADSVSTGVLERRRSTAESGFEPIPDVPVAPVPAPATEPSFTPLPSPESWASIEPVAPVSLEPGPKLELIDALPVEPLKIVEQPREPRHASAPGPVGAPEPPVSVPATLERNLDFLPDPFAEDVSSRPRSRSAFEGPEVAPGHGSVASDPVTSSREFFTPSASNPYLREEPEPRRVGRRAVSAPAANDYESIASDYVARKGFKERMTLTAMGVAAVLGERMGRTMMDDLPVITRADGSVADVGTTWWEQDERVQRSPQARPFGVPIEVPDPMVEPMEPERRASTRESASSARLEAGQGAIASRIAPVEEAYPEVFPSRPRHADVWESALAALDERVEDNLMAARDDRVSRRQGRLAASVIRPQEVTVAPTPVEPLAFGDAVGAIDTIDEPDGLERDTQFLYFRAPGNHPEVQDTGSYINYLIDDEFKRNPSSQARHHAKSYLRVHEGGQNTRAQAM